MPAELPVIQRFLFDHGLRISEALALTTEDFISNNRIRFKAAKGGNWRIVKDRPLMDDARALHPEGYSGPLFHSTYRQVYGDMKRHSLQALPPGHTNYRVTHVGRASLVQAHIALGKTNEEIADLLGMADPRTVDAYRN